ncbi:MAG: LamG-like jellyroll fold domain-containing protein [Candidatus Paceibacterota bacterium]
MILNSLQSGNLNKINRATRGNFAFTLIELLVVIAIIGILSALIVVGMSSTTQKATIAKAQVFSNSLRNSLMNNLISEWKLDGSGNDLWGGNNGSLVGATHLPVLMAISDCISGQCYQFDGTEDYIDIGDKDNLSFENNIFTFSIWINANRTSNLGVLGKRGLWEYSIYSTNGNLRFYAWNSAGSYVYANESPIEINKWIHFIWTANGSNAYLYKNGSVYGSPAAKSSNNMNNTAASFRIGHGGDGGGQQFMSGMIDEVRVFSAAMSTSQVQQNYFAGLNKLFSKNQINQLDYQQRLAELSKNYAKN